MLGDGAPWIWNLAQEHFPRAIPITDLYHAKEHLHQLARLVFPVVTDESRRWLAERLAELEAGAIEALLDAARQVDAGSLQRSEIDKACNYLQVNRERMHYADYRRMGLFVGSGNVEARCKSVVAQRLKLSGMHWRVHGATAIIALRCLDAGTRWDEIWQWFPYQTKVA